MFHICISTKANEYNLTVNKKDLDLFNRDMEASVEDTFDKDPDRLTGFVQIMGKSRGEMPHSVVYKIRCADIESWFWWEVP